MKRILCLLLFVSIASSLQAQQLFYSAELVFNDGTVKKGLANSVLETHKRIKFKTSEKGEIEYFEHTSLKRVTYFDSKGSHVFDRLSRYTTIKSNSLIHDEWFQLIQPGYVSIYLYYTRMGSTSGTAGFKEYFAFKEGEPGGRLVSLVASVNSNATFKRYAPIYFSDYPELCAKIKNKELTYVDLLKAVDEYNSWHASKNN